jgi:hypothetical protein
MQTRFSVKTEAHHSHAGWSFTTWMGLDGKWYFEILSPDGTRLGRGFYNEREARSRALQLISLAA